LLLGLGAIAVGVGGVGIANVMVISVFERRSEIGRRGDFGASRRRVAEQVLARALLISVLVGVAGTVLGAVATLIYAPSQHHSVQIPALALYGGVGASLAIGAIVGLSPSMQAACLSPTEAVRTVWVPEPLAATAPRHRGRGHRRLRPGPLAPHGPELASSPTQARPGGSCDRGRPENDPSCAAFGSARMLELPS
jgi:hypothetical protein